MAGSGGTSSDAMRANVISGQCHRYQEYEINPMNTIGPADSKTRLTKLPRESSSRAAPITGAIIGQPGTGVCSMNVAYCRTQHEAQRTLRFDRH